MQTDIQRQIALVLVVLQSLAVSSCVTTAEIAHIGTTRVTGLDTDRYTRVETMERSGDPADRPYFLVELVSNANLAAVVRKKEMAFLYYRLRFCSRDFDELELYSSAVLVDTKSDSADAKSFVYYAPVPINYVDAIESYLGMQEIVLPTHWTDICIGLGAGNMVGMVLETNFIPVNFDKTVVP